MRLFLRDEGGSPSEAWIVAGTARSGTTWLAEAIERASPARLMFEPFHSGKIEELEGLPVFPYLVPGERHERLERYSRLVLSGRVKHPWVDSHLRYARTDRRLVKEIRANLFLRWLHELFPKVPILFLMRHPCAVVLSRIRGGWSATEDLEDMLSQPQLLRDHLAEHLETIDRARTQEERHAAVWCIHNLVPLKQFGEQGLRLVWYEHLVRDTEREIHSVFRDLVPDEAWSAPRGLDGASATAGPESSVISGDDPIVRWQKELSPDKIDRILRIVADFGLDQLYGDTALPLESGVARYGPAAP